MTKLSGGRRVRRSAPILLLLGLGACTTSAKKPVPAAEAAAIADSIRALVRQAYDLSQDSVPQRMLSVYPLGGRVVSATAGRVSTSRDSLGQAVDAFWDGVGQFMVNPTWRWDELLVDVIDRDAAVMTARYTVPHWTDRGTPHVIGGVWTAVWQRRDGRWVITNEHLSDMSRAVAEGIERTMTPIPPLPPDSLAPADSAHKH
jgi:Domain of unknown function (DUF4440)